MRGLRANARWGGSPRGRGDPRAFLDLFRPILTELDQLFWLLDLQSGPFSITQELDFFTLEPELQRYWVDLPGLPACGLWRPGVFSRFGELLVEDEGGYMFGIPGPEARACRRATELPAALARRDESVLTAVGAVAPVFIWTEAAAERPKLAWAVYSTNEDWLSRLRQDSRWTESPPAEEPPTPRGAARRTTSR